MPRNTWLSCYGKNHERGKVSLDRIMDALNDLRKRPDTAAKIMELHDAALADEQGETLDKS